MNRITRYWVAALLLLAMGCARQEAVIVTVKNNTELARENETIEIPWEEVTALYAGWEASGVVVTDSSGVELPSQVIYRNEIPRAIIFLAATSPGKSTTYLLLKKNPAAYSPSVFGRLVPERYDDLAWENTLIAYRVYGPALEATGEISNGIDAWVKSTPRLVIDKWYATGDYHRDHGEGLDCYKVGRTLGAGAMAPLVDSAFVLGNNFVKHTILDQGPLRFSFELTYAPYAVREVTVIEKRVITLDAGTRFNRIEAYYENAPEMEVAAGIVLREGEGMIWADALNGVIAYREPQNHDNNEDNGHTAVAVIFPQGMKETRQIDGHLAGIADYTPGKPFVYHAGAGWSKGGFATSEAWHQHVTEELTKIKYPLEVTIKKR
ncbi:MAG: DUF4861 domain-containing protein [Odoribacteraceae bacterium]|jgi:hypothetical protein|nr:DUF4861 domain-containing protein [Odoribacteraceae bacterium]